MIYPNFSTPRAKQSIPIHQDSLQRPHECQATPAVQTTPRDLLKYAQRSVDLLGVEVFPVCGKEPKFDGIGYGSQKNSLGKPGIHPAIRNGTSLWSKATGFGMTGPS